MRPAAAIVAVLSVGSVLSERPLASRRRQQDADDDAATRAAAPPWVETTGFQCHPNARWELQPGLTNGKAAWTTTWHDVQWHLYHRPGSHHYWVIDSAEDDSSAPVGKTDTGGENGGPVPRSSSVADDMHTPWHENCDDPVVGNTGTWESNHQVVVRAPLSAANCDAIAEQAAKMAGCGALRGEDRAGSCSGCGHPWVAMAVRHPIMWRDASQCRWAAICVEEALQQWILSSPDLPALRRIRDAQLPAPPAADACLRDWVDFTDPCPTWGDNALLGGWPGVVCNGTRVVGLGLKHSPGDGWPAELTKPLLDMAGVDRGEVHRLYHSSGLEKCVSVLPSESLAEMDELRYISLSGTSVTELPATICQLSTLGTLELSVTSSLQRIPACLCESDVVKSVSLSAQALLNQPDCLPRSVTVLSIQRQQLRAVPAAVANLVDLFDLDLRNNLLTNLTDLSKLQKLASLKLTDNQLESLPRSMFELSALQRLWLDVNKLTSLPSEIGQLVQLTELKLDDNRIVRLPDEIGHLQFLEVLQADAAGLTSLPPTINDCRRLRELYLDNNGLKMFPDISNLVNLRIIRASNNSLSVLDDTFAAGLTNLTVVELRANGLNNIPISIGHLPNLQDLVVAENNLVDLPILYYARELRYLHCGYNKIRQFSQPKLWRSLTGLQELHIHHNQIGPSLPDEIEFSGQLRRMIANDNRLTSLPDTMASLVELEELQIQNNALTALPGWTGTLPKLKIVDATNNSIFSLPAVADSINHMYLYQNPINATSAQAERVLANARSLSTFDISASSAARYIWDTVPGFNQCGRPLNRLRDDKGYIFCVPRLSKPRSCPIDEDCPFTVAFMDEFGIRSRIGGVANITVVPLDRTAIRSDASNHSVWPLLLADDRNGGYTGVIPAHEMISKGTHSFQLFKDGYEFWAPQTNDGTYLCDPDDTPPYPHCPLDLNFDARSCGDGAHPDAINGTTCECDSVEGKPLERVSEDVCVRKCDSETSSPSADHLRCDCKQGFYDTSKVGLVVCHEDSFNLQRTVRARKAQVDSPDPQCLPCPPCLECSRNESTPQQMIGVPVVKARHRMNLSSHRMMRWRSCPKGNACEQYVYDCLGQTNKSGDGSDVREEVCPSFNLNYPNISCSRDHEGPLCNSCGEGHTLDDHSGSCEKCESLGDLWWLLIVSLAFVGIVPVLLGLAQTLKVDEKVYEWLQECCERRCGKSSEEIDVRETAHFAKDIRHLTHFWETTKIAISFAQVAALMPGVVGVDLPPLPFSLHLPGFGLNLRGTLECFIAEAEKTAEDESGLENPSQIYFDAWLLHVIGLPMLMFTPVALFILYQTLRRRLTSRHGPVAGGREEELGTKLRAHAFFCIYLLYPSQTEAIFKVFECRNLGCHDKWHTGVCIEQPEHCESCDFSAGECHDCPERWLEDDMKVSCNGYHYHNHRRVAQVLIGVIAAGFPVLVWTTLYRAHQREVQEEMWSEYGDENEQDNPDSADGSISPPSSRPSRSSSVISRDQQMVKNAYTVHYQQQFYYWEPLDMVRKLTLTGLISLLGKGTVSQIFVAIMVTFFFFCLHIACAPYRQREDNILKACVDLELFFVMLVTLVKKLANEDEQAASDDEVPDAFIGDRLKPEHYDLMVVISFFILVVAAYILTILYKIFNMRRVVRFRQAYSWRRGAKRELLLFATDSSELGIELTRNISELHGSDGTDLRQQSSHTTLLPSPSPRNRHARADNSGNAQRARRSAKLDEVLGLSVQPQEIPH